MNIQAYPRKIIAALVLATIFILLLPPLGQLGIKEIPLERLKAKYADQDSRFMNINGTEIHYRDQGQGPVIVALHGIVDSLHTWEPWVKVLGPKYRFVRLDLPGFGLTGPLQSKEKYTETTYVTYLNAFLNKLKIQKCHLVGNSLGGAIAWNYAVAYPDQVEKLVLIDPAGYPMELPWPVQIADVPVLGYLATKVTPRFIYRLSLKEIFYDQSKITDTEIDRFYELSLRPGNRDAFNAIFITLAQRNADPAVSAKIKQLKVPTLLLWGKEDRWIPVTQVKLWQRDVPGLKTVVFPKVGHVPQLEIPVESAQAADAFLKTPAPDKKSGQLILLLGSLGILLLGYLIVRKKFPSPIHHRR